MIAAALKQSLKIMTKEIVDRSQQGAVVITVTPPYKQRTAPLEKYQIKNPVKNCFTASSP